MHPEFCLHLCPGVGVTSDGDDLLFARADGQGLRHRAPGAAARTLVNALAETGGLADHLITLAQAAEPSADAARLYYLLALLEQRGMLSYTVREDGQALATLEPMTPGFRRTHLDPDATCYRLSRFAWLHREGDCLILDSSLGHSRLRLEDERLAILVSAVTSPQTVASLGQRLPDLDPATIKGVLTLLASAQALFPCTVDGRLPEDGDPALRHWDYHDLLFHSRSRAGRHDAPFGATYPLAGVLPHAPAIKPAGPGHRVPLPRPDSLPGEPAFFAVVEARRSIRDYGDAPLTLSQLGTLLWFVARVRSHQPANPEEERRYEATLRPVAGGGAMHELEFYLTVTHCADLEPALYHYDPMAHALEWVCAPNAETQGLLDDTRGAAGLARAPDVLITLTARARMAWKYQGMAYAATLKHVGVIYQQLYLVATALRLAPCALGAGNADRFAAATGIDYYAETSVGEFALSTPAHSAWQVTS